MRRISPNSLPMPRGGRSPPRARSIGEWKLVLFAEQRVDLRLILGCARQRRPLQGDLRPRRRAEPLGLLAVQAPSDDPVQGLGDPVSYTHLRAHETVLD